MNMDIPVPKIVALQMGPKAQNGNFIKKDLNSFNYI
jgi:hypothetical protein